MDNKEIETKVLSTGLLSDEIEIEPKDPVNPAGKPGVGGLAAIPSAIGSLLGADGFCSIYNYPLAGLCILDPDFEGEPTFEGEGFIPSWCLAWSTGPLCDSEPIEIIENQPIITQNICFDANFNKIDCYMSKDHRTAPAYGLKPGMVWQEGVSNTSKLTYPNVPFNDYYMCFADTGGLINCDTPGTIVKREPNSGIGPPFEGSGKCFGDTSGYNRNLILVSCPVITIKPTPPTTIQNSITHSFDRYLRVTNPTTGVPTTNEIYNGGYPIPPPPPEPEPEPIPPFDPGANPFDPTLPDPVEGQECATIVCECIALVVNALGAVNNTILKVDETLLGMVDQLDEIHNKMPNWFEKLPLELLPILSKLGSIDDKLQEILTAINDISVNVTKEAETNFWDVLGGMFSDIFGLVEFIIEKIIYLVVPENTDFIRENITMLNATMDQKFEPVNMLKVTIQESLMAEQKAFEDIEMNLPIYGRVKFMEFEWVNFAVPVVRSFLAGVMIIITSVWAYRKITSDMVR